ncbi:hypothetical protein NHN26_00355 [Rhodovulum tesquicola]|uniref:hypothetical protein n=1 Tax=Rhodovulum tesquicola TaxID=540254 RepID=UPI0020976D39|nr:hypothetical protein [Rhodovulum tesquicola]MCO8143661.1 hypothetical protein [Rhodovulum tesquicola]
MKKLLFIVFPMGLAGCMSPTSPVQEYASANSISLRYSAYDSVPTLTAEARDMAIAHCAKFGKFANYQGGNAANALTAEEIHRFACESRKADDSAVIAGQSKRPGYIFID